MTRRHIGPRERLAIFTAAGGVCYLCNSKIDGVRDRWEVERLKPTPIGCAA